MELLRKTKITPPGTGSQPKGKKADVGGNDVGGDSSIRESSSSSSGSSKSSTSSSSAEDKSVALPSAPGE